MAVKELIDITTLRLGNILNHKGELNYVSMLSLDIDDEYTELIGITPLGKRSGEKSEWIRAFGYDLKPENINEEWLLKFGFKYEKMHDTLIDDCSGGLLYIEQKHYERIVFKDGFHFVREESGTMYGDSDYTYIKLEYVHQLQNLYFTLTGEELKLK